MNDQQRVLEFVMAAGEVLLRNGAEVSRTQQTMEIMVRTTASRPRSAVCPPARCIWAGWRR